MEFPKNNSDVKILLDAINAKTEENGYQNYRIRTVHTGKGNTESAIEFKGVKTFLVYQKDLIEMRVRRVNQCTEKLNFKVIGFDDYEKFDDRKIYATVTIQTTEK